MARSLARHLVPPPLAILVIQPSVNFQIAIVPVQAPQAASNQQVFSHFMP